MDEEPWREPGEPWVDEDGPKITARAAALLAGLDPVVHAERQQIKIVLASLGRSLLDRDPTAILADVREQRTAAALGVSLGPERAAMRAAVGVLEGLVGAAGLLPADSASRLRIIAFKELFRAHVLRHAAIEDPRDRPIQQALEATSSLCLHDDDRFVRIEALRAIGITLRNLAVLRAQLDAEGLGQAFLAHVFPKGVEQIFWILDRAADHLRRYPDFGPSAFLSTGWYYLSTILPIFWLFPDNALRLADRLTRAGASTGVLEAIALRLQGKAVAAAREQIRRLYLVPSRPDERGTFITDCRRQPLEAALRLAAPKLRLEVVAGDRPGTDTSIAVRLIAVHDFLARCWEIKDPDDIGKIDELPPDESVAQDVDPSALSFVADPASRSPLGASHAVCAGLGKLARRLHPTASLSDDRKRAEIESFRRSLAAPEFVRLLAPVRSIAHAILDHWLHRIDDHPPPGVGDRIRQYKLGEWVAEGRYGRVHRASRSDTPAVLLAVKVFKRRDDADGSMGAEFVARARFNERLAALPEARGLVKILDILDDSRYPAYVMELCPAGDLQAFLDRTPPDAELRLRLAAWMAKDVGSALLLGHRSGARHGNLQARTVLVQKDARERIQFKIDCFEVVETSGGDPSLDPPLGADRDDLRGFALDVHDDAWALACLLVSLVNGAPLDPRAPADAVEAARGKLPAEAPLPEGDRRRLLRVLRDALSRGASIGASAFLAAVTDPPVVPSSRRSPLTPDQLGQICDALVGTTGICRQEWLAGIDADVTSTIALDAMPRGQCLIDLNAFNDPEAYKDRAVDPLVKLLENARTLVPQKAPLFATMILARQRAVSA